MRRDQLAQGLHDEPNARAAPKVGMGEPMSWRSLWPRRRRLGVTRDARRSGYAALAGEVEGLEQLAGDPSVANIARHGVVYGRAATRRRSSAMRRMPTRALVSPDDGRVQYPFEKVSHGSVMPSRRHLRDARAASVAAVDLLVVEQEHEARTACRDRVRVAFPSRSLPQRNRDEMVPSPHRTVAYPRGGTVIG